MTQMGDATKIVGKPMKPEQKNFDVWLTSELRKACDLSKVADYTTRKTAGSRVDILDTTAKVWQEFLAQTGAPIKN